ncbi:MAG: tRNA uridine-5-carboxymethylaminomethyl(34) synthesis GTPase MnmE [Bacteroidetes bacterium]|nr:tRNA uridine-5-carboxymethylaminomethyl(34) synthesis GTPase MnmE [Bacteroidota bacterium]MBM3424745.1 tRNA uridine-5-carboxymethylaminomethyl(34) synthesis GTPase MnmE [Bacteroidota bacterium]
MLHDTIVALATGGTGALSVIRLSGTKAKQIAQAHVARNLAAMPSHHAVFTLFKTLDQTPVDEVLLLCFDHGKSFTGEETVEIHCHGSSYIQSAILQALIASGARMAEPGEFTQRAFANGKMDLSQAEAVADLIASNSRQAHAVALNQMRGGFSHELSTLREKLIEFASLMELELDFGEEDLAFADRSTLLALVGEVLGKIQRLIKSFALGNAMKEGVPVAIVGAPNAGKSSLLNALLGEERAIVSDIPGTTRDVIEEVLTIDGIRFRLMDTAGIRATNETIEAMGIARSQEKIERARLVLALSDGSDLEQLRSDEAWVAELKVKHPDKTVVWIANKKDLNEARGVDLAISALSGDGLEELMQRMSDSIQQDFDVERETVVSNARHVEALQQTQTYLRAAQQGLKQGLPADLVAMDLRAAMRSLGNITGEIELDTDILGTIFSRFCIGK